MCDWFAGHGLAGDFSEHATFPADRTVAMYVKLDLLPARVGRRDDHVFLLGTHLAGIGEAGLLDQGLDHRVAGLAVIRAGVAPLRH
ncbi:hypothetical protein BOS5A_110222 [Bosea sp. EC-HK365B]|nr:hypothetical protein BOSE21B_50227 [Bosea sp. 21B]CAD5301490.1 hypothetical protein BOSE7B_90460 [Bosea sp. 7B]VVT51106.1 hypothetical protein BOS5A_110222 [Bosea sp. EC-HK365B]VXB70711.1 hypothetical protein BOSE127_140404 [Bosea sp. 127]